MLSSQAPQREIVNRLLLLGSRDIKRVSRDINLTQYLNDVQDVITQLNYKQAAQVMMTLTRILREHSTVLQKLMHAFFESCSLTNSEKEKLKMKAKKKLASGKENMASMMQDNFVDMNLPDDLEVTLNNMIPDLPDNFLDQFNSNFDLQSSLELRKNDNMADYPEMMNFSEIADSNIDFKSHVSVNTGLMKEDYDFQNIPDLDILSPKMPRFSNTEDLEITGYDDTAPNLNTTKTRTDASEKKSKTRKFKGLTVDKATIIRSSQIRSQMQNTAQIVKSTSFTSTRSVSNSTTFNMSRSSLLVDGKKMKK